jgi:hypothetical protein
MEIYSLLEKKFRAIPWNIHWALQEKFLMWNIGYSLK